VQSVEVDWTVSNAERVRHRERGTTASISQPNGTLAAPRFSRRSKNRTVRRPAGNYTTSARRAANIEDGDNRFIVVRMRQHVYEGISEGNNLGLHRGNSDAASKLDQYDYSGPGIRNLGRFSTLGWQTLNNRRRPGQRNMDGPALSLIRCHP